MPAKDNKDYIEEGVGKIRMRIFPAPSRAF